MKINQVYKEILNSIVIAFPFCYISTQFFVSIKKEPGIIQGSSFIPSLMVLAHMHLYREGERIRL